MEESTEDWNKRTDDRLKQENAELREALKSMIGKGIDLLNVEDVTDEEDAFSIHSKFNDAIINSQLLLNKHDN
ncbi:coil containing protein [Vibrio phage 1.223.O._10N.261.48.A9]|nr:coil containing protein [Vibrio phage 1.223.O._10N.261.48.A9]